MKNEEILKKAIKKAQGNGYVLCEDWQLCDQYCNNNIFDGGRGEYGSHIYETEYEHIIFSHDFAKAFWGTELNYRTKRCLCHRGQNWQYHLRQMVLEPEPLKYLEEFIK